MALRSVAEHTRGDGTSQDRDAHQQVQHLPRRCSRANRGPEHGDAGAQQEQVINVLRNGRAEGKELQAQCPVVMQKLSRPCVAMAHDPEEQMKRIIILHGLKPRIGSCSPAQCFNMINLPAGRQWNQKNLRKTNNLSQWSTTPYKRNSSALEFNLLKRKMETSFLATKPKKKTQK